jgi:hypothetical protein
VGNLTNRERVIKTLKGETVDRLPMIEWAMWWNETVDAWSVEDSTIPTGHNELNKFWGLMITISFG